MRRLNRLIFSVIKKHSVTLFFFTVVLFCYGANTLHTQFPDEFDNIFGGFLINRGMLPYTGFFTHHNPGAYVLASLITPFSGRSFVLFRYIFALVLFTAYAGSYWLLRRRLGNKTDLRFYHLYGILIAVGATYWWGQMLLSETIVGYLLVPVVLLLIMKRMQGMALTLGDVAIISILTFLSLFVSLTYIYLIPIILGLALFWHVSTTQYRNKRMLYRPVAIILFPYLLFFLYLGLSGSAEPFYFASIQYNMKYYIYNFPTVAGQVSTSPLRYAVSIAKTNIDAFYALLTQITSFNLSYPFNISLAIGTASALIYFLIKRKFGLCILLVAFLFYTNARSQPLTFKETDFHSTVFIMTTIAYVSYVFFQLFRELHQDANRGRRTVYQFLFLIAGFYWIFCGYFLGNQFLDKAYGKFMGRDPLIYDWPQAAKSLNRILTEDDYYWIGPFELQELLFIRGKMASKYFWFLPANSRDERIMREISHDLMTNRPKVIVFKKWWANFGVRPEDFNTTIVDILDKNYFQIKDLENEGIKYRVLVERERNFDFETEFFFDLARKEEIIRELEEKGMIERI